MCVLTDKKWAGRKRHKYDIALSRTAVCEDVGKHFTRVGNRHLAKPITWPFDIVDC
jgi:hypothetical protein